MTVVVGVANDAGVLLAADSQISWMNRNVMSVEPKVCKLSEVLAVGYCGSGRLGQILIHEMEDLESPPLGRDEMRWVVKTFVPYFRGTLFDAGFLHVHHNVENFGDSAFLFAVRNRLFHMDGDFSVGEADLPFDATGSGMETAIGAMSSVAPRDSKITASRRELIAMAGIEAAVEHTNFVGGNATMVQTVRFTSGEKNFVKSNFDL